MTNLPRFQSVSRATIYVQVAEQIREAILARSLSSGERLPPERELAQQFGVSRATVREALRHLQAQGLLVARGRTSPLETASADAAIARFTESLTHVVRLQDVSVADLVELRVVVEIAASARAAAAPVAAHLDEARAALATMERPETSAEHYHEADVAFHVALVAASGNHALRLVMLAVRETIRHRLDEAFEGRSFERMRRRITEQHRAILRAVERGDAKGAARLLRDHLSGFYGS
jgi:DNA-binding FadR family transcriptional regulator